MFDGLLKDLVDGGGGVRAYDNCAREARGRIAGEPENSAALLLIAYAAQRFVDAYDDQPLTVEAAAEELKRFTDITRSLDQAYLNGSAQDKIDALNRAAAEIARTRSF